MLLCHHHEQAKALCTHTSHAAGVPTFLVNAALSGWIKWVGFEPPAMTITALLGCAIVYLLATSATWIRHLIGPVASSASPLVRSSSIFTTITCLLR